MRTLGNVIWHIPYLGFLKSLIYAIEGLFWCLTVVGIPLGMGLFQLSLFALAPFSKGLVSSTDLELLTEEKQNSFLKGWSLVIRILYFPFGLLVAFFSVCCIVFEFLTLIGIPCALVESKALSAIFNPVNKKCVPRVVAEEIERRKGAATLSKYSKKEETPVSKIEPQAVGKINLERGSSDSISNEFMRKAEAKTCEELKLILQNKEDYNIQFVMAAEKVLLDKIASVASSETVMSDSLVTPPLSSNEENNSYQPLAQSDEQIKTVTEPEKEVRANVPTVVIPESTVLKSSIQREQSKPKQEVTSPKTNVILLITVAIGFVLVVAGALTYFLWYLPYAKDRDALRTYVVANNVFLRSSQQAGVEYNVLTTVPYGQELITYRVDDEWAEVKIDGQEGYAASNYLLTFDDFTLLNDVWGDADSKNCIESSKCRLAILNYLKNNRLPSGSNGWQIYTRLKGEKPNTVFYPRIYDKNSKFTDFVFLLKNRNESEKRILVCYSFEDDTEKPIFRFSSWAPSDGYIQNIVPINNGVSILFDTGARTKISL